MMFNPDDSDPPKKKRRRQALSCTGACIFQSGAVEQRLTVGDLI